MKVILASAEISPWAKVGGLADVVGSLPKALARLGHEIVVAVPAYGFLVRELKDLIVETRTGIEVQVNWNLRVQAVVSRVLWEGFEIWLIDGEERFRKVDQSENLYSPQRDDYLFFSHAILRCCEATGWMPDAVHAHDWQMGLLPAIMRETKGGEWNEIASLFTIHNFAHQGEFGVDTLDVAGIPRHAFTYDKLETFGGVNFLKSGCAYADVVTTVSPTYAAEITTDAIGGRLSGLMHYLRGKGRLKGILNGIDTKVHDPAIDRALPANFSDADTSGKEKCRQALIKQFNLKVGKNGLLCGMISRLSEQKGFDILVEAAPELVEKEAVFLIQALGSERLAGDLARLNKQFPKSFVHVSAFDPDLAQRIYGGSDVFLMPSHFEPCGLGQMFAMRYGTVPIVRYTGGLADTVIEGVTGFVFGPPNPRDFSQAVVRAIEAKKDARLWNSIVKSGMTADWSWDHSAPEYQSAYNLAVEARNVQAA